MGRSSDSAYVKPTPSLLSSLLIIPSHREHRDSLAGLWGSPLGYQIWPMKRPTTDKAPQRPASRSLARARLPEGKRTRTGQPG